MYNGMVVTVSLSVTRPSGIPFILNLTLEPSNSLAEELDSHIIELLQVEPHSMRGEQIPKSDYRVTLKVSHRQSYDTKSPTMPEISPSALIPSGQ